MLNETTDTLVHLDMLKIHSIESFGTYDGPGIRLVVFLQGCPFQCLYCANPDTMRFGDGSDYPIAHILEKAERMKPYFANGGGVTASGGEPCCQAKPLIHLFGSLQAAGIHTCLDTNGHIMNKYVEELLDHTDLVLLDVKHIVPDIHQKITGKSNDKTLAFAHYLEKHQKPFWLRYVLVPDLTDDPKHLHELGQYFESFDQLQKLEIQPYHKLGVHKWEHLGKEYELKDTPENTLHQLEVAKDIFEQYMDEVVIN